MKLLKILCGLGFAVILATNIGSMSRWSEARGVYDDICYLRQAHLFQKFGLAGLNTDVSLDDDHYLALKLKQIGFPNWSDPAAAPCHNLMPVTGKLVVQYPPGTGFLLALFPEGFQVIPLYAAASVLIFCLALAALSMASTIPSLILATIFGDLAIYLMINPTKASYSVAPTMVACALAGFLTARLFLARQPRNRLLLAGAVGLSIGLAVNFRLPNLLLSSGYCLFFLVAFLKSRTMETFLQGAVFGAALLAGMVPTLLANFINAGSPLATTYGAVDVTPPALSFGVISSYLADMQFVLLALAMVWTVVMLRERRGGSARQTALVTAANLLVNLAFFLTHPIFTPYYIIPVAMLSLWSLLFAVLTARAEAGAGRLVEQATSA